MMDIRDAGSFLSDLIQDDSTMLTHTMTVTITKLMNRIRKFTIVSLYKTHTNIPYKDSNASQAEKRLLVTTVVTLLGV